MSKTMTKAEQEFDILEQTNKEAIVLEFKNEILALVNKFGNSGQSGGSAPYVSQIISNVVKKLCMQQSISPIMGTDDEWNDMSEISISDEKTGTIFQNKRNSAIFKDNTGAYYLEAIVWKGEEEYDTFTGGVYIDDKDFEFIRSSQFVKFPFKPKTFYIDVVRVSISKEEAEQRDLHYIEDSFGECYYIILKDPKQLDKVFEYYDKN